MAFWTALLQVVRLATWLLWAGLVGYFIYFASNRAPHLTQFGNLKPHVELLMLGLPIAAVAMGFLQLMIKQRITGALPKR